MDNMLNSNTSNLGTNLGFSLPKQNVCIDLQRHETPLQSSCSALFDGFLIESPVALLVMLGLVSNNAKEGLAKLHKWQIQCMLDFANQAWSDQNPYQASLINH